MPAERNFRIYESVYHAGDSLSKRQRGSYLVALCEYYFDGVEPTDLPRDASMIFNAVKHRVRMARICAMRDGRRESSEAVEDGYDYGSEAVADGYDYSSDIPTQPVHDTMHVAPPAQTYNGVAQPASYQVSTYSPLAPSPHPQTLVSDAPSPYPPASDCGGRCECKECGSVRASWYRADDGQTHIVCPECGDYVYTTPIGRSA